MESISIEITERCPAALEALQGHSSFSVNLAPKGGVGDFEILNSNQEVVIIGQKHLSTISFLENTSRSEVLTLDLQNLSEICISCPPTEEIAFIRNSRMGLFLPNTLEIQAKESQRSSALNFRWESICTTPKTKADSGSSATSTEKDQQQSKPTPNFQVLNNSSHVVAEVFISRVSSRVTLHLSPDVTLSPVQTAVLFSGLAFQIYSVKKQKSALALLTIGLILALILGAIIVIYVSIS